MPDLLDYPKSTQDIIRRVMGLRPDQLLTAPLEEEREQVLGSAGVALPEVAHQASSRDIGYPMKFAESLAGVRDIDEVFDELSTRGQREEIQERSPEEGQIVRPEDSLSARNMQESFDTALAFNPMMMGTVGAGFAKGAVPKVKATKARVPKKPDSLTAGKVDPSKFKSADEFVKSKKQIFHGTSEKFNEFDLGKSADGTVWFTDNVDNIKAGKVTASGKGRIVERFVDENNLKLGGWKETDKFSTDELISQGYDGLKLSDKGETTYQIFSPDKLQTKSQLTDIWKKAKKPDTLSAGKMGADVPEVGYHVAPANKSDAVDAIGIKAREGTQFRFGKEESIPQEVNVWSSKKMAEWFKRFKEQDGTPMIIKKVNLKNMKMRSDPETFDMSQWDSTFKKGESGGGFIVEGNIPKERILKGRRK